MFKANDIRSGYGEVTVLQGLTFAVNHEIFAILGANGAGKTTLMKTISKVLPLTSGTMHFDNEDISHETPYRLAAKGLSLVPQEYNVFPNLTVAENLNIGSLVGRREKKEKLDEVYELFPAIVDRAGQNAGSLSGGETQMVAVGRALMQDPKMILLDEPTAGLAPKYVDNFFATIKRIHEQRGITIMLAEQNAARALEIADRVMILSLGKIFLIEDCDKVDIATVKQGYHL